ncbi:hypothetical protein TNCV_4050551 [Trichonephila clavipes]|nr:hypothetical protein TNCV_4050551 [Trichonephila clavipes]
MFAGRRRCGVLINLVVVEAEIAFATVLVAISPRNAPSQLKPELSEQIAVARTLQTSLDAPGGQAGHGRAWNLGSVSRLMVNSPSFSKIVRWSDPFMTMKPLFPWAR